MLTVHDLNAALEIFAHAAKHGGDTVIYATGPGILEVPVTGATVGPAYAEVLRELGWTTDPWTDRWQLHF